MIFHVVRSYRLRNIFINRSILEPKEKKYRLNKRTEKNIYLIRKNNAKRKRLRKY